MGLLKILNFIVSHPLNRGHQLAALWRFANWQLQSRLKEEVIHDWIDGAKLAARRGMTGATGNIYCGLHEYTDMSFVLHALKPGDTFVDIGANIGSYTVLASKVCGAETIAVEPDPDTVQKLRRNVEVNALESKVTIFQTALGSSIGRIRFTIGLDTVNKVAIDNQSETRDVPLTTLDALLTDVSPRVIKMDVEGFEAEVLGGGRPRLLTQI